MKSGDIKLHRHLCCDTLAGSVCVALLSLGQSVLAQEPSASAQPQSQEMMTATPAAAATPAVPITPAATAEAAPKIPNDQLDSLVAPVALYPDQLLAQTLAASTYPLEV